MVVKKERRLSGLVPIAYAFGAGMCVAKGDYLPGLLWMIAALLAWRRGGEEAAST